MKNLLFFSLALIIFSCSSEPEVMESDFIGTYVLNDVQGSCLGIPINGTSDEAGCIDISTLEINCLIIELSVGGLASYSHNGLKKQGTYTIENDGTLTICTERCLAYTHTGNSLIMLTGSIVECDPAYTFLPSTSTLDEILVTSQRRSIQTIKTNGIITRSYKYNPDGSLQSIQFFDLEGNLSYIYAYTFTPLTATAIRTSFSSDISIRYEYYDESTTRTRRDYYYNGELTGYRLYFHDSNECWIDRSEDYETNNSLESLNEHTYSGSNCDLDYTVYKEGQTSTQSIYKYDGMSYYAESTLLNVLKHKNTSNVTSKLFFYYGEIEESSSYNSLFTYGNGGFPETETRTYLDGNVRFLTYEYDK